MTVHRSFILSVNKELWFESIFHGAYGILHSLQRPGPKTSQPFASYLSGMLADGLREDSKVMNALGGQATPSTWESVDLLRYHPLSYLRAVGSKPSSSSDRSLTVVQTGTVTHE